MGLFGGGNSSSDTTNVDRRVINDNSGQDNSILFDQDNSQEIDNSVMQEIDNSSWTDNSIEQEIDNSLQGDYNNNNGTIQITDGGAFGLAENVSLYNSQLTDSAISLASGVSDFALQTGYELGDRGLQVGENVAAMGLDTAENLALGFGDFVNEQGNRNLNAALMVSDSGIEQLKIGSELMLSINDQNTEQQFNNTTALNNGFKSSMQFVEDFSRSDGASIAETTNKTMMFMVGAAVVGIFIFKRAK